MFVIGLMIGSALGLCGGIFLVSMFVISKQSDKEIDEQSDYNAGYDKGYEAGYSDGASLRR